MNSTTIYNDNKGTERFEEIYIKKIIKGETLIVYFRYIFIALSLIIVITIMGDYNFVPSTSDIWTFTFLGFGLSYTVLIHFFIKKKIYLKWFPYITPVFDALLITFAIYGGRLDYHSSWISIVLQGSFVVYFLFIILSILRYNPVSPLIMGTLSSLGYTINLILIKINSNAFNFPYSLFFSKKGEVVNFSFLNEMSKAVFILLAGIFAYFVTKMFNQTLINELNKEIEKSKIKELFGKYISKKIVDNLIKNQNIFAKGIKKKITVMFIDIVNFTLLTEQYRPELILASLNIYFKNLTDVIIKYNGIVDKFIGDAVMSGFGIQIDYKDHALQAVRCAIEIVKMKEKINKEISMNKNPIKLDFGIGINTGDVIIGNVGGQKRADFTAIGNTVNIAAKIEKLTRKYKVPLLISKNTYDCVKNKFKNFYRIGVLPISSEDKIPVFGIKHIEKL